MKVRDGFVSNSSSSSFMAIGKYISVKDIDKENVYFIGYSGGEGTDYFELTPEMKSYIKEKGFRDGRLFCEAFKCDEERTDVSKQEIIYKLGLFEYLKLDIITFDRSYCDGLDIDDFIEYYGEK